MHRTVSAHLEFRLDGPGDVVLSIAVAAGTPILSETLSVLVGGTETTPVELTDRHGSRLHRLSGYTGPVSVHYHAVVAGQRPVEPASALDHLLYLRPSRFAESDKLYGVARSRFGALRGQALLDAVSAFVFETLSYVPGASNAGDSAATTLASQRGVCRDYAHVVVALLRACDVPARIVSAYAPGLKPMDFHVLAEAWIDGHWRIVDATRLAPRQSLVRIATGRDGSDIAFLTSHHTQLTLDRVEVGAVAQMLPSDDQRVPVLLP
ncbi:transglutaminase family protein [Mycetocola manganoxydans]|uniref:Transglutaminase family protein n=1 Tax=Mycetocola manganoxydans TaxID=699879 RepID=A0A3L7A0G9_9MICO|nr:transglutaminase family protein [Mycetocola manganoxydans]RLP73783.1 transglutaminase family protein [Mycetocola manganoxydans]GHD43089.1 putative transglutaminase-like protein [Mycetocola manganoxydans]